ncbi:MAG: hypothetical protein IT435_16795 [Phycisphaerales bacterium]|nr:hypothetical protein [Phycisphaerales bacterium]
MDRKQIDTPQLDEPPPARIGFKSVLASTLTLAVVGALGIGIYRGLDPLEQRVVEVIGTSAPRVTISWPSLSAISTDSQPASTGSPLDGLLSVSSTSLDDVPTWLPKHMQEQVLALAAREVGQSASPLSDDPLRRVGSAMEKSGWFDGRPTVRREPGSKLFISGRWRIPSAVVREAGRDYLISWDGKPMPVIYEAGQSKLKALIGVSVKPADAGAAIDYTRAWPGEDIQAGLELLRLIQDKPWINQVVGVDVGSFQSDHMLSIVTTGGGRLNWGGRPNKPRLGEAGTGSKLATIGWIQKLYNSIDAGGKTIDLYWQGRPLVLDVSATAGLNVQNETEGPKLYPTSPLPRD